jgi:hypothetical protein
MIILCSSHASDMIVFNLFSLLSTKCSRQLPWCRRRHPRSARSLRSQLCRFYSDVTCDLFSFVWHKHLHFLDQVCEADNELNRKRHNHRWLQSQTCNESMLGTFLYMSFLKSNTKPGIQE